MGLICNQKFVVRSIFRTVRIVIQYLCGQSPTGLLKRNSLKLTHLIFYRKHNLFQKIVKVHGC
jgi:hypothetical protein